MALTRRQRDVYDFVCNFIETRGFSPSLDEIAEGLGLRSLATVHKHLGNLTEKGLLKRQWNRGRSIEVGDQSSPRVAVASVPLLGQVAAGKPIEAIETTSNLVIPDDMLGKGDTYALRVSGDSMVDHYIQDGDYVIVENRASASNGETVVALIDGIETTLKQLFVEGHRIRLRAANPNVPTLELAAERVRVQGVVIGLIRKFS